MKKALIPPELQIHPPRKMEKNSKVFKSPDLTTYLLLALIVVAIGYFRLFLFPSSERMEKDQDMSAFVVIVCVVVAFVVLNSQTSITRKFYQEGIIAAGHVLEVRPVSVFRRYLIPNGFRRDLTVTVTFKNRSGKECSGTLQQYKERFSLTKGDEIVLLLLQNNENKFCAYLGENDLVLGKC